MLICVPLKKKQDYHGFKKSLSESHPSRYFNTLVIIITSFPASAMLICYLLPGYSLPALAFGSLCYIFLL